MADSLSVRCCVVGGGPAGMMLGLLLARAGVSVCVLEKHADFLRDFRGDTVHPSTLQVLHELGLLEQFLARPHDEARDIHVDIGGRRVYLADFGRLDTRCKFIAMVPQWHFLDFLRDHAVGYPGFRLLMETRADDLLLGAGRVAGVRATSPQGEIEIRADLVVACDGRHSTLRDAAGLKVRDLGAPIDVLWMRVARRPGDASGSGGRVGAGRFMAMIDRGDYWQCAFVIHKGGIDALRERGIGSFRDDVAALEPGFRERLPAELPDWDAVKLLSVTVDRLEHWWKPGLLFIGDAAHAMSPLGGVGINLAIQDAVAAANILARPLADASMGAEAITPLLQRVQDRRMLPTRVTQGAQVIAQNNLIDPLLDSRAVPRVPFALELLNRFPPLRALPAYAVGIGVRPEHVHSPEAPAR
jgi:2-polyprenyl-6-methoxyphenol hydroxylase-like FAD-dependent oxidoreductase